MRWLCSCSTESSDDNKDQMAIEAKHLRAAIAKGVKSIVYRSMRLTGERGEDPRPEYLTTAAICFSLCDFADEQRQQQAIRIRAEEMTSAVWAKSNFRRLVKQQGQGLRARRRSKKRAAVRQRDSTRSGNVDITLLDGTALEHPFAVVENKGLLTFTKTDELGAGSKAEFEKDIKRNFEFVLRNGASGGVQFGAFTFYLRDTRSVLQDDGKAFCKGKQDYLARYLRSLDLHPDVRVNVLVDTLDDNLYATEADARERQWDDGPEAVEMDPPWHLAFGVISLYRVGDHVSDTLELSQE